jgi:DNA-binding transcriptional regulator GbsR (MarR family)
MNNTDLGLKKDKLDDSSIEIEIEPDDFDGKILSVLKISTDKKIPLTIDSIMYLLGLDQTNFDRLHKRLRMLSKYKLIRKICERKTSFWVSNNCTSTKSTYCTNEKSGEKQ